MPRTASPVHALQNALQHALDSACPRVPDARLPHGSRAATEDDLEVFAMFAQPAVAAARDKGFSHSYAVVFWCGALNAWFVYFDGEYGYQLRTHEANVLAFMRDLRAQVLVPSGLAREAYRARL